MKNYTTDEILDMLDYMEELEEMDTHDFCAELGIKYSIKYNRWQERIDPMVNYAIKTYGHDILIHWIQDDRFKSRNPEVVEIRAKAVDLEINAFLSQLGMGGLES